MDITILNRDNKTLGKGINRLFVTFDNTDVSIVNALRRVITTNIPTLVFRGFPYKDNQINILKTTIAYNTKRKTDPVNPCSSENNVIIKSVCFSGKKSR